MKRFPLFLVLFLGGVLLMGADGCSSDPNVEGAKLDLRNKDFDRALQNLETALQKNPDNAAALNLKGQVLQEKAFTTNDQEQHTALVNQMLQAYNRAAEIDPTLKADIDARLRLAYYNEFQRGVQAFNRGRENAEAYNEAVLYFGNAGAIQPDSSGAYANQAFSLINAGRPQEAIAPFEKAVAGGAADADTYVYLGELYVTYNRAADAVTLLEKGRQQFPTSSDLLDQLLNAYVKANQMDRAMTTFSEAVQSEPNNKLYRYNYGSLLLNAERYDEAIEQLQVAVNLDPEYANAQYNLGAAFINKAVDVNERVQQLDDKLRQERNSLNAAQQKERDAEIDALVQQRTDLFKQAITPLEKARQLMGEGDSATQVCQTLFTAYVQTGQQEKAQAVSKCAGY